MCLVFIFMIVVLCVRFIILEYTVQSFIFFLKMPQNNKAPKRKENFLTYLRLSWHTTQNALLEYILSFVCFFFMKVNSPVTSCTCNCCKKACNKGKNEYIFVFNYSLNCLEPKRPFVSILAYFYGSGCKKCSCYVNVQNFESRRCMALSKCVRILSNKND